MELVPRDKQTEVFHVSGRFAANLQDSLFSVWENGSSCQRVPFLLEEKKIFDCLFGALRRVINISVI